LHGIDLGLVRTLLVFRRVAARSFSFDPLTGIPGRDRKALEERQRQRKETLVNALREGSLELVEIRRQTLAWRDVLGRAIEDAHRKLARLRAEAGLV
jgi:hypothetical protein